jgi:hypothetical protein
MAMLSHPVAGLSPVSCGAEFGFTQTPRRTRGKPAGSSIAACRQSQNITTHLSEAASIARDAAKKSSPFIASKSISTLLSAPVVLVRAPLCVTAENGGSVITICPRTVGMMSMQSPRYNVTRPHEEA